MTEIFFFSVNMLWLVATVACLWRSWQVPQNMYFYEEWKKIISESFTYHVFSITASFSDRHYFHNVLLSVALKYIIRKTETQWGLSIFVTVELTFVHPYCPSCITRPFGKEVYSKRGKKTTKGADLNWQATKLFDRVVYLASVSVPLHR